MFQLFGVYSIPLMFLLYSWGCPFGVPDQRYPGAGVDEDHLDRFDMLVREHLGLRVLLGSPKSSKYPELPEGPKPYAESLYDLRYVPQLMTFGSSK